MDYTGDAAAIAGCFVGVVGPAADPRTVRDPTSTPDSAVGPTPAVFVFLDTADLPRSGNGSRLATTEYVARVLLDEAADLAHDAAAILGWCGILADVLKDHAQLDGRAGVARAIVDRLAAGLVDWGGRRYAGIDVRIRVTSSEGWAATA